MVTKTKLAFDGFFFFFIWWIFSIGAEIQISPCSESVKQLDLLLPGALLLEPLPDELLFSPPELWFK